MAGWHPNGRVQLGFLVIALSTLSCFLFKNSENISCFRSKAPRYLKKHLKSLPVCKEDGPKVGVAYHFEKTYEPAMPIQTCWSKRSQKQSSRHTQIAPFFPSFCRTLSTLQGHTPGEIAGRVRADDKYFSRSPKKETKSTCQRNSLGHGAFFGYSLEHPKNNSEFMVFKIQAESSPG